jgi:hypothetical protein
MAAGFDIVGLCWSYMYGVLLVLAVGLSGCGIFLSVQQLIEAYMGQG